MAASATSAPDQSDPWAWRAWAAQNDPQADLYAWRDSRPLGWQDLQAMKPALVAAGKWTPDLEHGLQQYISTMFQPTGNSSLGPAASRIGALPDSLAGYTAQNARSSGANYLTGYFDPTGAQIAGTVGQQRNSMTGSDYATAAALMAAAYFGGGALAGAGGAGAGAGTVAGTGAAEGAGTLMGAYDGTAAGVGATAAPTAAGVVEAGGAGAGTVAADAGGITGGSGLTISPSVQASTGFGTAGTVGGAGAGAVPVAAGAGSGSGLTPALISGASGLVSAYTQGQAAKDAAGIQSGAAQAGIAQQQEMFDAFQKALAPYVNAGVPALTGQMNLVGLNGNDAQLQAINSLQQSPQFTSALKLGENRILANASATGGLRGGNTQGALAQFAPQLLASTINDQFSRLGGLTSLGQNSAAGVGNAGMNVGNNVSNLLQQQGAAGAGGALAGGRQSSAELAALTNALGLYFGRTGGW